MRDGSAGHHEQTVAGGSQLAGASEWPARVASATRLPQTVQRAALSHGLSNWRARPPHAGQWRRASGGAASSCGARLFARRAPFGRHRQWSAALIACSCVRAGRRALSWRARPFGRRAKLAPPVCQAQSSCCAAETATKSNRLALASCRSLLSVLMCDARSQQSRAALSNGSAHLTHRTPYALHTVCGTHCAAYSLQRTLCTASHSLRAATDWLRGATLPLGCLAAGQLQPMGSLSLQLQLQLQLQSQLQFQTATVEN